MKLATASEVLARLNLAGIAATNTVTIDSALEAATAYLESKLRTSLKLNEITDFFNYTPSRYATFSPITLYLSQRFMESDAVVTTSSTAYTPLGEVITGSAMVLGTDFIQDKDKGSITLLTEPSRGYRSIAVAYEAGFTEGGIIPDWLKEGAISAAILVHHTQGLTHSKKDAKDMTEPLAQTVYSHINEHIYTPYSGLYAESTVID